MNCRDRQELIAEYLNGELATAQNTEMTAHVNSCGQCKAALEQQKALRNALRQMPVEPARSGFAQAALQHARLAHATEKTPHPQPVTKHQPIFRHWFAAGFGGAMAAGMALWAVFSLIGPFQPASELPMFTVSVQQTRNVSVAINVPEDMDGVTLTVALPENFELSGHHGKRQIAWQTRLKKGRNVLTLPVLATAQGQGQLVARVARDQQSKLLRVNLKAVSADKTSYLIVDQRA